MDPTSAGSWTSLGVGVALIFLVTVSIFKLIGAWVIIASERKKENDELKIINEVLRHENNKLREQLYGREHY